MALRQTVADCARQWQHPAPQLIAVSKQVDADRIDAAIEAGCRHFGENRIEAVMEKWAHLATQPTTGQGNDTKPVDPITLHFIGGIQSRKAADVVAHCAVIHSLDRPRLAEALAAAETKLGIRREYLIQVNQGNETQKGGVAIDNLPQLLELCRDQLGLRVVGLMTLPPQHHDPEPFFRDLTSLAQAFQLPERSMGMSADFPAAIKHGATYIRVGTALFGARRNP
ncbi:MAG: YggS family pyridoxal phosphate-dependent enzyme [Alphaproteobacteria bacterium]|nr:YggS family pyridoxal phosphate-dependent enzyme [Alphaproteobacteria bacterium]